MTRTRISVDEGGIRHEVGETKRYIPFGSIVDVELRTRLFREPAIVVSVAGDAAEDLALLVGGAALEIHRELVAHLEARRAHVPEAVSWGRAGRPVAEWLAHLDATTQGGYRTGGPSTALALRVAADADADIDARAGAFALLVRSADGDELVRVAKLLASRPLPPLALIAAHLAPGGRHFVADEAFVEALTFIEPADRAALLSLPRDERTHAAYVAAASRARQEIEADAQRPASTSPAARPLRLGTTGSDRDTSRWIGRSWGL